MLFLNIGIECRGGGEVQSVRMVEVDSLTPRLRQDNVVPGQAHVDSLPGAVQAVQGPEDDGVEEGGARLGLTVVGG